MSRFALARDVRTDLDEIWNYIAIENNSPAAANRQIDLLYQKFAFLAAHPLIGEARDDLGPNLRALVVRPYLVLYRAKSYGIEVAQVVHSARDINAVVRR